jgi:hypothetical protein
MRASPSPAAASRSALGTRLALPLALLLAGCPTHDVETRPFQLRVTLGDGTGLEAHVPADGQTVGFGGTARRQDDTTLVVQGATLAAIGATTDVTLAFRGDASPGVAFPQQLDGAPVTVLVHVAPSQVGPRGEALPIVGFAVATGTDPNLHYQFLIGELPPPEPPADVFVIGETTGDVPAFRVVRDAAEFEPARCGPVYYDVLRVFGASREVSLRHGDQGTMPVGDGGVWNVRHVVSWHREDPCDGGLNSWTQLAAWR